MFCSHCGAKLEQGVKYCPNCGKEVHEDAGEAVPQAHAAQAASSAFGRDAQAAPRKMALWKKIAIGVVVAIIGIVALGWWVTSPLVAPIDRQLAALRAGDVAGAYEQTAQAFKSATSQADFEKFISDNPILTKVTGINTSSRSMDGNSGKVLGTLKVEGGATLPVEYLLTKENGEWRIMSIDFNPKPE